MVQLTAELIRKKSEHNDETLAALEEIALHQLEIEKIEVLGSVSKRLKILLLQDNIIGKIENLQRLKDLEQLNLAMNNVKLIEGLEGCEFLKKLDLTLNFIGLQQFRESMENLQRNRALEDLHLLGNPCLDWPDGEVYVVAKLSMLKTLNGKTIKQSSRIIAGQRYEELEKELQRLVASKVVFPIKGSKETEEENGVPVSKPYKEAQTDISDSKNQPLDSSQEDSVPYTPRARTEMYRETAAQKAEKETREKARLPKERNYQAEHEESLRRARLSPYFANGTVKQCNEADYPFKLEEDKRHFYLTVSIPSYLDTSLIDCDVHPDQVCIVIKNKMLRLSTPAKVRSDAAGCQRSLVTGDLKVTMPKHDPSAFVCLKCPDPETPPAWVSPDNGRKDHARKKATARTQRLRSGNNEKKMGQMLLAVKACELSTIGTGERSACSPSRCEVTPIQTVVDMQTRESLLEVPPLL